MAATGYSWAGVQQVARISDRPAATAAPNTHKGLQQCQTTGLTDGLETLPPVYSGAVAS